MMKKLMQYLAAATCAALLASCGGGGGGGDSTSSNGNTAGNSPTVDQSWLQFTPNAINLTVLDTGPTQSFTIDAKSSKTISQNFNIGIFESTGLISSQVSLTEITQYEYKATLNTASGLTPGVHTSQLEVRLCVDDPLVCNNPISGSPWKLPITVTVNAGPALQITPSAINLVAYQGIPTSFSLAANISKAFPESTNMAITDPGGLLSTDRKMSSPSALEFDAQLNTATSLSLGTHTGQLQVQFCQDASSTCLQPVLGSPALVPVTITVKPAINLTSLSVLPQVLGWTTYQGNPAHTGYVPATFDPNNFVPRWTAPGNNNPWTPTGQTRRGLTFNIAVDNGMLFRVLPSSTSSTWTLQALSEDSGQELWHYTLNNISFVNPPALGNGKVYVTSDDKSGDCWVFDQQSGALLGVQSLPVTADGDGSGKPGPHIAPTIYGDSMFEQSNDSFSQMIRLDANFNVMWKAAITESGNTWSPAVDNKYAYVFDYDTLQMRDIATGALTYQLKTTDPYHSSNLKYATVALSNNNMAYVYDGNDLLAFDLVQHTQSWATAAFTYSQPVLAGNSLYTTSVNVLEARSAATGVLQWSSESLNLDSGYSDLSQVVATNNLAFVAAPQVTLAVDLTTHKVVWRYPKGGTLAISNRGVLYIMDTFGNLTAINLQ
jgi:hypothetical protein